MEAFGRFILWIILFITSLLLRGIVVSYCWNWIIVKLFLVRTLNVYEALAISCFILTLNLSGLQRNVKKDEDIYKPFTDSIIFHLTALLICYIASLYI